MFFLDILTYSWYNKRKGVFNYDVRKGFQNPNKT